MQIGTKYCAEGAGRVLPEKVASGFSERSTTMQVEPRCEAERHDASPTPRWRDTRQTARFLGLMLAALGVVAVGARAAETPLDLRWDQLVPAAQPKTLKPFFQPKTGAYDIAGGPGSADAPPPKPEGRWMSDKARTEQPAEVVPALDGKTVRIGGYVVPLDFDATSIKEFLLVPFVGACIHVPPPPANQIVYVKAAKAFDIKGQFDPVWVTGRMKTEFASTGLADAGYSIDADAVEPRAR